MKILAVCIIGKPSRLATAKRKITECHELSGSFTCMGTMTACRISDFPTCRMNSSRRAWLVDRLSTVCYPSDLVSTSGRLSSWQKSDDISPRKLNCSRITSDYMVTYFGRCSPRGATFPLFSTWWSLAWRWTTPASRRGWSRDQLATCGWCRAWNDRWKNKSRLSIDKRSESSFLWIQHREQSFYFMLIQLTLVSSTVCWNR